MVLNILLLSIFSRVLEKKNFKSNKHKALQDKIVDGEFECRYLYKNECFTSQPQNTVDIEIREIYMCVFDVKCEEGLYIFKDKCFKSCPKGTTSELKIKNFCMDLNYKNCSKYDKINKTYDRSACFNDCQMGEGTKTVFKQYILGKKVKCKENQFDYENKCVKKCPKDYIAVNFTRECIKPPKMILLPSRPRSI